jgi:hypothetical protein
MHHPILLADQSTLRKIAEAFDKIHAAFFD